LAAEEGEESDTGLALHFDVTVPLARYVAHHHGKLIFPFRRYQIQPVWRGERPQAGRYRQFYQCDFDVIGDGEISLQHDAEMPAIMYHIFKKMQIGSFTIRINNRKILCGYLESLGIGTQDLVEEATRIVDAMLKVGTDRTLAALEKIGLDSDKAVSMMIFFRQELDSDAWIAHLKDMSVGDTFDEGVCELEEVVRSVRAMGVPEDCFCVDPSLARGLGYYTGTIYEARLNDNPGIGSICGGGRFDNLASNYTTKKLPGVGASIGLTRLIPRLIEKEIMKVGAATAAPVLITSMDQGKLGEYLHFGTTLRDAGIKTEVFLEPKKFNVQMKYANRKGFTVVIIAGDEEFASSSVVVKNLQTGQQETVTIDKMVGIVQCYLNSIH
jgi:histidyl-tRNA synthetase